MMNAYMPRALAGLVELAQKIAEKLKQRGAMRCKFCARPLGRRHDPEGLDCGGDCLACIKREGAAK